MYNLGHGANVEEIATRYQKSYKEIIDFSSNINPFKSEVLETKLTAALTACEGYPDIHYTRLRAELGLYLDCEKEQIIVGNGATELIYLLMRSIRGTLGIVTPTFSEYERSARISRLKVSYFPLIKKEKGFSLNTEEIINRLAEIDALMICNPNNPTSHIQDLTLLAKECASQSKILIVDETFMEFVEEGEIYSVLPLTKELDNIIVIKAVTKFFGVPGLRLGYAVTSNEALLNKMYKDKEPWTVNSFASELTPYMLRDKSYIEMSKVYFREERAFMMKALGHIPHIKVYKPETNFILLELMTKTAEEVKTEMLIRHNILIRDASNFRGLDERFIRIAIKTREQNEKLIQALQEIIK